MPRANQKPRSKNAATRARVNKSAWIRNQPSALSAKDVVSKAKAEGIKLSLAQVYTARSTAKRGASSKPATGPKRPKRHAAKTPKDDLRKQFIQLAVRLGTDEAQRLLDRIVAGELAT